MTTVVADTASTTAVSRTWQDHAGAHTIISLPMYTTLTWIFRILWFVFSFLCKDGRGGLISAPFRQRQSGRGSSFFLAAVGEQDVVYARPCHRCSAQEHAEGSSRNGRYLSYRERCYNWATLLPEDRGQMGNQISDAPRPGSWAPILDVSRFVTRQIRATRQYVGTFSYDSCGVFAHQADALDGRWNTREGGRMLCRWPVHLRAGACTLTEPDRLSRYNCGTPTRDFISAGWSQRVEAAPSAPGDVSLEY